MGQSGRYFKLANMTNLKRSDILKALRMICQGMILWGVFWLGNQISIISKLPIPGSIFGMVLLFLLLLSGIMKLEYVQEAADFLIKHMMFFFVAMAVGLMNSAQIFYEYGFVLALALLAGLFLPLAAIGVLVQILHKEENKCSR